MALLGLLPYPPEKAARVRAHVLCFALNPSALMRCPLFEINTIHTRTTGTLFIAGRQSNNIVPPTITSLLIQDGRRNILCSYACFERSQKYGIEHNHSTAVSRNETT